MNRSPLKTTRRAVTVICLLAACLLAGCGASAPAESTVDECIVLTNGTTLCGDEARTWCGGFADATDRGTAEACASVASPEPGCEAYMPGSPASLECAQRSQEP